MLNVLHRGLIVSFDLDQTTLTGNANVDKNSAYITSLVAGSLVAISSTGVKLADGALDQTLGFLVLDASGGEYENIPALASGLVAVAIGNHVVETDQVVAGLTIVAGQPLFAAAGLDAGKITNVDPAVAPATSPVVGLAASAYGLTSTTLKVFVK